MVKNVIGFRNGVINMAREFKTVQKMKAGDEEKHRYLSCKAGQEGAGGMAAAIALGGLKEVVDFCDKTTDPVKFKAYKGYPGIIADGVKDMKNNFIGSAYGVMHPKAGSCDKFLKKGK